MALKFFLRSQNLDTTCDAGADLADYDLDESQGSGPNTSQSNSRNNDTWIEMWTFDVDVSGNSPATGDHNVSVEITAITAAPGVRWRLQEVNSSCTVLNSSSYTSEYTSTGIKTDTLNLTWSTGDRLRLSIELRRNTGHSSSDATISLEDADSFVNTPFTAGGTDYVALPTTDVEQLVEGVLAIVDRVRVVDDTEQIVEGLLAIVDRVRVVDETEEIGEGVIAAAGYVRVPTTDVVQLSESVIALVRKIAIPTTDVEQLVEQVLTIAGFVRQVDEVVELSEGVIAVQTLRRVVNEVEQIVESVIPVVGRVRVVDEVEQISESVIAIKTAGGPVPIAPSSDRSIRIAPKGRGMGMMHTEAVNTTVSGTPQSTVDTFARIPGLSGMVVLGRRSRIWAAMTLSTSAPDVGTAIVGGIAIEIDGVVGTEITRYIATLDVGAMAVVELSPILDKGEYLVQGLYRRVSGTKTFQVDGGNLVSFGVFAL